AGLRVGVLCTDSLHGQGRLPEPQLLVEVYRAITTGAQSPGDVCVVAHDASNQRRSDTSPTAGLGNDDQRNVPVRYDQGNVPVRYDQGNVPVRYRVGQCTNEANDVVVDDGDEESL